MNLTILFGFILTFQDFRDPICFNSHVTKYKHSRLTWLLFSLLFWVSLCNCTFTFFLYHKDTGSHHILSFSGRDFGCALVCKSICRLVWSFKNTLKVTPLCSPCRAIPVALCCSESWSRIPPPPPPVETCLTFPVHNLSMTWFVFFLPCFFSRY